jgi:2-hydroxy-4-carboxymuconate semialdehyde hemiacetal dehydrogenase
MTASAEPGLRVGFLGYGAIAAEHARALSELGCELQAVAGPRLAGCEDFARAHGVARVTTDVGSVIEAPDVDVVVVASPNDAHAPQAIAAFEAGKHVLCEVPLATSAADATAVVQAHERAGPAVRALVCHTQRFWEPLAHLSNLRSSGRLNPCHVSTRTGIARRENVGWTGRKRSWTDSIIWHHGAHAVDIALWLLDDEVRDVQAEVGRRSDAGDPLDLAVTITTRSDALATLVLSYNSLVMVSDLIVFAENDTFQLSAGRLTGIEGDLVDCGGFDSMATRAVLAQDAAFIAALRDGAPCSPSPGEALRVYQVLGEVETLVSNAEHARTRAAQS